MISKALNVESLFPNDDTKPNIGGLLLSIIIILSVFTLILETEIIIYKIPEYIYYFKLYFFYTI